MGLSNFTRRFLNPGSFPQLEGQDLPDSVEVVKPTEVIEDRAKVLGRKIKAPKQTRSADQSPKI